MYHDTEQVPRRGSKLGGAGMEAIRDVAQQKGSNGVSLRAKLQCITIGQVPRQGPMFDSAPQSGCRGDLRGCSPQRLYRTVSAM